MESLTIILGIGLEYVDAVFQTIRSSDFSQYTITGMKTFAVLFFLINILKKYNEGVAERRGYSWGLSPNELAKKVMVVLLVIFSTQVLGFFDTILVAIESQYRDTAPALLPLQLQDIPIEEEVGAMEAAKKAMALLYEGAGHSTIRMENIGLYHQSFPMDFGFIYLPLVFGGTLFFIGYPSGILSPGHQPRGF